LTFPGLSNDLAQRRKILQTHLTRKGGKKSIRMKQKKGYLALRSKANGFFPKLTSILPD
jgi:hypothetical protein